MKLYLDEDLKKLGKFREEKPWKPGTPSSKHESPPLLPREEDAYYSMFTLIAE